MQITVCQRIYAFSRDRISRENSLTNQANPPSVERYTPCEIT